MFNGRAGFPPGPYYEVVFSPTGQAFIRKNIHGVVYRVASATHNIPRNVWFDVELLRSGLFSTVKVNGKTLFDRIPTSQLAEIAPDSSNGIGLITHWSPGRFDNLLFEENVQR